MVTSRILFTAKQKDELWERWKNGQSVLAISRALERRNKTGVQRIVALNGGIAGGADSEEKHEPVSDIDTVLVDSLKALDPKRPIREADIRTFSLAPSRMFAKADTMGRIESGVCHEATNVSRRVGRCGSGVAKRSGRAATDIADNWLSD